MNILVTGAHGFVGKNLVATLKNIRDGKDKTFELQDIDINIWEFDRNSTREELETYCEQADFIFHLAGVNRPETEEEFQQGNCELTALIVSYLKKYENTCPIVLSSSIQAKLDNPYGKSKREAEQIVFKYAEETGVRVFVFQFPNIFGKWCRPNYNSVVATFCYNIANGLPIKVNDPKVMLNLVYIDDVVRALMQCMADRSYIDEEGYCHMNTSHQVSVGEIADILYGFRDSRSNKMIPYMEEGSFEKKLYSCYLSYLPTNQFAYSLKMNVDERGSFTELFKSKERGQVSVNISKPGITKGEHWHHTKNEKFVVVSGKGLVRFRKIDSNEIIEYHLSGNEMKVVDIPTGYTHSIVNEGDTELITVMWCNECFDPHKPDTYYLKVDEE